MCTHILLATFKTQFYKHFQRFTCARSDENRLARECLKERGDTNTVKCYRKTNKQQQQKQAYDSVRNYAF